MGRTLTAGEAAELLNVSSSYAMELVERGEIATAVVGDQRVFPLDELLAFKARRDRDRAAALENLVRLTEDVGGYEREGKR